MDYFFRTQRRAAISQHETQIGIDYVEYVEGPSAQLKLYFIPATDGSAKRPAAISTANIRIQSESGLEQHSIQVTDVELPAEPAHVVVISLAFDQTGEGELPIYTLQLREVPYLDPFFDQVNFSLQVDEPSELDPQATAVESRAAQSVPEIDYLAKDYHTFRQLMLNRFSLLMPQWQERSPVDLGHVLVELLAYAGDYTSYYQDAVATEAYLSTARRRVSVGRHARLIDYAMHEGCNARVWVQVQVEDSQSVTLPAGSKLLTQVAGLAEGALDEVAYQEALRRGATVFETMHDRELFTEQSEMQFYSWGAREFVLPKGSTSATLRDDLSSLKAGQVLIFRQVRGPMTGEEADADPSLRHAVRLTQVIPSDDPLGGFLYNNDNQPIPITEITWHDEDALPFDLIVSNKINHESTPISMAHGNIVLADHGRTIENEALIPPTVPDVGSYRPTLRRTGLAYGVSYDQVSANEASAAAFFRQRAREARPAITLTQTVNESEPQRWQPLPDLLDSDRFTRAFVVEMESDRRATLRFGNGIQGQQPLAGTTFTATYRVGNGLAGNVGRDVIRHLFVKADDFTGDVKKVCNWLPAQGGMEPEPISEVRLYAPTAFQTQKRCVTEEDYVAIAKSHPDVQDASAILRWTGSWYTAIVLVKRRDNRLVDAAFQKKMLDFMEGYRVAGYDITVRGPRFVSLDIALTVHVATDYFASTVRQMLLESFSAVDLPTGQRAFFHPDHFTFGQAVYLSKIISHAVKVDGVTQVVSTRFQRWGRPPQAELETGFITISELEIAQLQNQAQAPQHGRIVFTMEGGRQ